MSYSQSEHLFAGVHELGVNDLIKAFFKARPRYWILGTPFYVPVPTPSETQLPNTGNFHYRLQFTEPPAVDIFPGDSAPFPDPLLAGQLIVRTSALLSVAVGTLEVLNKQPAKITALCMPAHHPSPPDVYIKLIDMIVDTGIPAIDAAFKTVVFPILEQNLEKATFPFGTLTLGAFTLDLVVGPLAEADQLIVRGNAL